MHASNPLRTWLVLGRASNLPTVWSNCLAGWLLGGGGDDWGTFLHLCVGATLLYTGGMYLNDAFDAGFDQQHRRERPIPSGLVSARYVWTAGFTAIAAGLALLCSLGFMAGVNAILLAGCILIYNAVHKLVTFSPVLMAFCRFFLYLTAAAAATGTLSGAAVWSAFALGCYITGLSCVARRESTGVAVRIWPLLLLLPPIALSLLVHDGPARQHVFAVAAILLLWTVRSLRWAFTEPRNVGRAVSGLLAGIVWVDWLAVADQGRLVGALFIAFFLLALLCQRVIPAT